MKYCSAPSHSFFLEVTVVRLKSCSTNFYTVFQKLIFFFWFWPYSMCGTSCWWSLFLLLSLTSLECGILVSQSCMFGYVAEVNFKNTVLYPLRTSVWHQNAAAELVLVCF